MDTAREFSSRLASLLRREQSAMADFLLALADFDQRRLWQEHGYTSLFHFLHRELGMSKGAAHYRKTAADLVRRVPEVIEPLRAGRLCITSIIELAKVLTPENREEVLPRFFHRSRQEAKAVSAELRPMDAAPHRTVVAVMPATLPALGAPALLPEPDALVQSVEPVPNAPVVASAVPFARVEPPSAPPTAPLPPRSTAEPLTAHLRRLHVTVSKRFLEKLEAARDALSHSCVKPGSRGPATESPAAGGDFAASVRSRRPGGSSLS